jgi:flagellar M-ring protein FliF
VVPKPELFSHDKQEPTASIVLKLRGVSELGKEEIGAITHLVATAVPGLKPSKVTLVDNKGHMLSGANGDEADTAVMASTSEEYRASYETRMKNTLESLLEKSLGTGKVKVTVSANMNFDRIVTNSETYNPEGQVVRSVQEGEEKEQSTEKQGKDNTSVANNLPGAQANQTANGSNRLTDKTDTTTNYEISKTVENHVQEPGKVNKLSIAVLVDGNYTDSKDGKPAYSPRTEDERKQIATLVKSAIGYDEKRGDQVEVVNMRFTANAEDTGGGWLDWLKADLRSIVQTLSLLVVTVLAFLFVIRPLMNRLLDGSLLAQTGTPALAGSGAGMGTIGADAGQVRMAAAPAGGGLNLAEAQQEEEPTVDLSRISGRVKSSTYNRLNELVDKHPEEALGVIRQWASRRT